MSSLPTALRPKRVPLSELPNGSAGRVCELAGQPTFCQRLREMGFCEAAVIKKISGQGTLMCHVCGAKVALSERAAQHIIVELIPGGI